MNDLRKSITKTIFRFQAVSFLFYIVFLILLIIYFKSNNVLQDFTLTILLSGIAAFFLLTVTYYANQLTKSGSQNRDSLQSKRLKKKINLFTALSVATSLGLVYSVFGFDGLEAFLTPSTIASIVAIAIFLITVSYIVKFAIVILGKRYTNTKWLKIVVSVLTIVFIFMSILGARLIADKVYFNHFNPEECFWGRSDGMIQSCIERNIRKADDISVCDSIESIQIRHGIKKENNLYFVTRDHCILTLIGYYYTDTSKLMHQEWCYELSDAIRASGTSLQDVCLDKFNNP